MSLNPLNDISSVYTTEVLKPQLGKKNTSAHKVEKGKNDEESSAKRVRQAVYDIRYRARREDLKLDQAYSQYMGHTSMPGPEKNAVKEKLGLSSGGSAAAPVKEETEQQKYKVRVTDKSSGKTYVRYATREKINQLRSNPNISSVEMTQYGKPYEGESERGEYTSKAKSGKGLDPVGHEDKDIDNDGDHDKTDKYLLNRRKVRGAAIQKKSSMKEDYSNWRMDLNEILEKSKTINKNSNDEMIKEKKVNNKVVVNPSLKTEELNSYLQKSGGKILEFQEIENLDEKTLTSAETKKKEEIVKSMKKNLSGFKSRYGKRAKEVMYATATARAKEVAEAIADQTSFSPQELQKQRQKSQLDMQIAQLRKQSLAKKKMTASADEQKNKNLQVAEATAAAKRGIAPSPQKQERSVAASKSFSAAQKGKESRLKAGITNLKHRAEKEHEKNFPGSRQTPKQKGAKETPSEIQNRRARSQVGRVLKYGHTSKEKSETKSRERYDSARD